jgi:hypothetical protein
MRFAATLALALGVALATPLEAYVSEAATAAHKHRIHVRRAEPGFVDPTASALGFLAPKPDWVSRGMAMPGRGPRPPSDPPSVEGYYGGGDAGFSWEPYGWSGTRE